MKPRQRSLTGLLLTIVLVPVIVGLIACLPVPLGDPEKSRIDPELSGVWLGRSEEPVVLLLEPYDKRSWLATVYELDFNKCADSAVEFDEEGLPGYAETVAQFRGLGSKCIAGEVIEIYKVWQTELGGERFMTWEPKGVFEETHGFEPEIWLGYRVDKIIKSEFTLRMVDFEHSAFEDESVETLLDKVEDQGFPRDPRLLRSLQRAVEKVIRRNVDESTLYEEPSVFYRIEPEDYDLLVLGVALEL